MRFKRTIDVTDVFKSYQDVKDYKSDSSYILNPAALKSLQSGLLLHNSSFAHVKNVRIAFTDFQNQLSLSDSSLNNVGIRIKGTNNVISIESGCDLSNVMIQIVGTGCNITIGHDTKFAGGDWGVDALYCKGTGKAIIIGEQSLFSGNIIVRNNDGHDIFDASGNKINAETDIRIGRHTWVCEGSRLLKGCGTKDNTIVGCGSIVTRKFHMPNIIIAGNPAKKIGELQNLWQR